VYCDPACRTAYRRRHHDRFKPSDMRHTCERKVMYPTAEAAADQIEGLERWKGCSDRTAYKCLICPGFHLTSHGGWSAGELTLALARLQRERGAEPEAGVPGLDRDAG
jgi:hypothetical protein